MTDHPCRCRGCSGCENRADWPGEACLSCQEGGHGGDPIPRAKPMVVDQPGYRIVVVGPLPDGLDEATVREAILRAGFAMESFVEKQLRDLTGRAYEVGDPVGWGLGYPNELRPQVGVLQAIAIRPWPYGGQTDS